MSLLPANMTVLWGVENPVEILDIGALASMSYEDSIKKDSVAGLEYVKVPYQAADRPELQGGQKLLLSWGRGGNFSQPRIMVIEEPKTIYGNGIKLRITAHDQGTRIKGIVRNRVFNDPPLVDVVAGIAGAYGMDYFFQPYEGNFDRVQNRESDYKYLSRIARSIGYRFWIEGNKIIFAVDSTTISEYGAPLIKFVYRSGNLLKRFEVTTQSQEQKAANKSARAEGFDLDSRTVVAAEATPETDSNTRLAGGSRVFDAESGVFREVPGSPPTGVAILTPENDPATVAALAQGARQAAIESQQTAVLVCPGIPFIFAGTFIEMQGVADKDAGIWRVTSSKHNIGRSGYGMTLDLDRENIGLTSGPGIESAPRNNVTQQTSERTEEDVIADSWTGEVLS